MKNLSININGYIEGYYGRILSWPERYIILKKLKKLDFNTYFYCPKEDLNHRLHWRNGYTNRWIKSLNKFCKTAKNNEVNILVGISPGLDFNFEKSNTDLQIIIEKARTLKSNGATYIAIMFDDIPPKVHTKNNKSEGTLHAELANEISKNLYENIFVVPRVYCDELIDKKCKYLDDFSRTLNNNIPIFYCGKKIVSDTNNTCELETIRMMTSNKIIFWDNLYANDYCPNKIFIGPYYGRVNFQNTMINPTGLINTDLLILDLIYLTSKNNEFKEVWNKILKMYKIPVQFETIIRYFFPINVEQDLNLNRLNYQKELEALDFLLWKWNSSLSREWYQYILILKQFLQLLNGDLNNQRVKKIFPDPLKEVILNIKKEQ